MPQLTQADAPLYLQLSIQLKSAGRLPEAENAEMLAIGLGVTIGGTMVNLFKSQAGIATNASFQITFVIVGLITLVSAWVFRKMDPRYFS